MDFISPLLWFMDLFFDSLEKEAIEKQRKAEFLSRSYLVNYKHQTTTLLSNSRKIRVILK